MISIFNYTFKNPSFLEAALLHPSKKKNLEFQRMEFLGDKLLSFELSIFLFKKYPKFTEGDLSTLLARLVSAYVINELAAIHISPFIKYTGNINETIIVDTFEAIIGAIYLDGGNYQNIIKHLWYDKLHDIYNSQKNAKNLLQEISQKNKYNLVYEYEKINNFFYANVTMDKYKARGQGLSKKTASVEAAMNLLTEIQTLL